MMTVCRIGWCLGLLAWLGGCALGQLPAAPPPPVTLTFVGDIMLAGNVARAARAAGSAAVLLDGVRQTLQADDLTVGNLECAVSTRGTAADKTYTFRASPWMLPGLRKGGVDAVTLANNHALDYGRTALRDTLAHLRAAGLLAVGAGEDAAAAYRPAVITRHGQRIALLGASRVLPSTHWRAGVGRPGLASAYETARVIQAIRAARREADVVILYLHWGREGAVRPDAAQRTLARACIDAGADLVVGSHPHVLQGFEFYHGRLIAYSLGNFLFTAKTKPTAMLQVTLADGRMTGAAVLPCLTGHCRVTRVTRPAARAAALAVLQARSYGVRIGKDGSLRAISSGQ